MTYCINTQHRRLTVNDICYQYTQTHFSLRVALLHCLYAKGNFCGLISVATPLNCRNVAQVASGSVWKKKLLKRENCQMPIPERTSQKMDTSENERNGNGLIWKGHLWKREFLKGKKRKRANMKRNHWKVQLWKTKTKHGKGYLGKGKMKQWQLWKWTYENVKSEKDKSQITKGTHWQRSNKKGKYENIQCWKSLVWKLTFLVKISLTKQQCWNDKLQHRKSEKGKSENKTNWNKIIMKRASLEKDKSGKEISLKGQFWKGHLWTRQLWKGKTWTDNSEKENGKRTIVERKIWKRIIMKNDLEKVNSETEIPGKDNYETATLQNTILKRKNDNRESMKKEKIWKWNVF